MDAAMLAEAGFQPAWFEDVTEGDTIMIGTPGSPLAVAEMTVTDLRPSGLGPDARRFMGRKSDGTVSHECYGAEWPCWILRRPEPA